MNGCDGCDGRMETGSCRNPTYAPNESGKATCFQEIFANDCDICCKETTMQLWLHFSSLFDFPTFMFPEFHLVLEAPNAEVCTIRPWEDSKASSLMAPMDISMEVPPVLWMVASWDGSENGEFATESRDIIGFTTRDRTIISQLYPYYLDISQFAHENRDIIGI